VIDLLQWPVIGPLLRWRHARTSLQLVLLAAAALVVTHGLFGPQTAPANLATVATWIHYRGLLVLALLAAGNVFCTGCPFVLVRDAGRRLHAPARRWPRIVRTKWIGIALFATVLFVYEWFDLWALPRATALLIVGYFASALLVDVVFKGATFCKYLCPIGQYNFIASTLSPLEVRARDVERCRTCATVDCIKGRRSAAAPALVLQRGCELALFLPAKVGNLDCTFCLDCVHACPHDNVAIGGRMPGVELWDGRRRSGIGRLVRRPDIAALAAVFVFGALVNAFAMTSPSYAAQHWIASASGVTAEWALLALMFGGALVGVPALVFGVASAATKALAGDQSTTLRRVGTEYAMALVPFGLGVWVAHYLFHFLTGLFTIVPVAQSAAFDLTRHAILGEPAWRWIGFRPGTVYPIQIGFILLGTVGSLAAAYRISEREYPARATAAAAPWLVTTMALAMVALWILNQPMEMRALGLAG